MADNPIILLHPVREPLDHTAVGALELLARMMLPMDTAERTLFWEGIVADIVSKGLRFFADGAAKKWPLRGSLKGTAAFL